MNPLFNMVSIFLSLRVWQLKGVKVQILHMEGCKRSKLQTQGCKRSNLQTQGCKSCGWLKYKVKSTVLIEKLILFQFLVHGSLCLLMLLHQATWPTSLQIFNAHGSMLMLFVDQSQGQSISGPLIHILCQFIMHSLWAWYFNQCIHSFLSSWLFHITPANSYSQARYL